MSADFHWEQPGLVVAVLAAALSAGAYPRQPKHARTSPASGPAETLPVRPNRLLSFVRRLLVPAAVAASGLTVGSWLVLLGSAAAAATLAGVTFLALVWAAARLYAHYLAGWSHWQRAAAVFLRALSATVLIVLLARPVWEQVLTDWHRPLLVALLDTSESMGLLDRPADRLTRADRVNAALREADAALKRLQDLYDVRLYGIGAGLKPLSAWQVVPEAPATGLAAALRQVRQMTSTDGNPPTAVMLISDGGENVETAPAVRSAAATLPAETALLAIGVGPRAEEMPAAELEPPVVPGTLGLRDRVRVLVAARVQGCAGSTLKVELLWDGQRVGSEQVPVTRPSQLLNAQFDLTPTSPGLHRLTARLTLPEALGGHASESHAMVDVRDERLRVLYLEETPRVEAAFVRRALVSDSQIELSQSFLHASARGRDAAAALAQIRWSDYDVVILGRLRTPLPAEAATALVQAVTRHGVGLLLAGGRPMFNEPRQKAFLENVCPVTTVADEFGLSGPLAFRPTAMGLQHPVLRGVANPATPAPPADADQKAWLSLPPLPGAARFGKPKPAAIVLATDAADRPLLAAQEVGSGRCLAAAWENTYLWALASDQGAMLHRHLWRQAVLWLANRRPHAWVLTDQPTYPLTALQNRTAHIRVRAGISGPSDTGEPNRWWQVGLELVTDKQRLAVPLLRQQNEWTAELPTPEMADELLELGRYSLEFTVFSSQIAGANVGASQPVEPAGPRVRLGQAPPQDTLVARTAFEIVAEPAERMYPTANLALLKSLAGKGSELNRYYELDELPRLLEELARTDRRQEVCRRIRFDLTRDRPWALLCALTLALAAEWALRKRSGAV